jgi:hypothetical protein
MSILSKDLKELYKNNHKIIIKLKKIEIEGEKFDIYNKMLEICNKKYKEKQFDFSYTFFYNKYCEFTQKKISKEFEEKGHLFIENIDKIDDDDDEDDNSRLRNFKYKKIEIKRANSFENKISKSLKEKYMENMDDEEIPNLLNNFDNNNILNQTMIAPYPNNYTNQKDENNDDEDEENYLRTELSKIDVISLYYKNIVNNSNSNNIIQMLFNPKEYFFWQNFTIIFKDFLYYNKKFKKLGKVFQMHTRNIEVVYSSDKEKNFYLNYPSKIKNYVTDDYYRPFLKPYLNFFSHKFIKQSHNYMKEAILKNPQFKEDRFNLIKFNH